MPEDSSDKIDDTDAEGRGSEDSAAAQRPTLSYAAGGPTKLNLKTIRKLPPFEANLAASKLEAHGVRCYIDDENLSTMHPLLFGDVRLQVDEADREHAEQILAMPASRDAALEKRGGDEEKADDDDDYDDDYVDDDYVEETYRCPKCRRKAVDLLPLSPGLRNTRLGCLFILLLPILFAVLSSLVGLETRGTAFDEYERPLLLGWAIIVAVLSLVVLLARPGSAAANAATSGDPARAQSRRRLKARPS